MYWAPKRYQPDLCALHVNSTDTVFWMDGWLYKQRHETMSFEGVETYPLFHFQEWKRYFRPNQLASLHHPDSLMGYMLSKEGAIPLLPKTKIPTSAKMQSSLLKKQLETWIRTETPSKLPSKRYCLVSAKKKFPPVPPAPECHLFFSWDDVFLLQKSELWDRINTNDDVTLSLTLQISFRDGILTEGLLDLAEMNLATWTGQPSILLIHISGAEQNDILPILRSRFQNKPHLDNSLIAAIISSKDDVVFSRKALTNMVNDAAPTRYVVSGLEIERGLLLSKEASLFAKRAAMVYGDVGGNVFFLPQFGTRNDMGRKVDWTAIGTDELLKSQRSLELTMRLDTLDCEPCRMEEGEYEEIQTIYSHVEESWFAMTKSQSNGGSSLLKHNNNNDDEQHGMFLDSLHKRNRKLKLSIMELGLPENEYLLRDFDLSPLMMVDRIGPRYGMITSDLASEVDEFGGQNCFNALKLVQLAMLGYEINVLEGAFAISLPTSRDAASLGGDCEKQYEEGRDGVGISRCDGCVMFNKEMMRTMVRDERVRPAKAALLWDDVDGGLIRGGGSGSSTG